jgi:hypothetical protein
MFTPVRFLRAFSSKANMSKLFDKSGARDVDCLCIGVGRNDTTGPCFAKVATEEEAAAAKEHLVLQPSNSIV